METQGPGCSMTQELDWRHYDDCDDDDETCLPEDTDGDSMYGGETLDCTMGQSTRQLYDLTQTSNNLQPSSSGSFCSHQDGCSNIDKSMSISDISEFLSSKGIPKKYCEVFEENYIDGTEFVSLSMDDIKAMVPPIGLARKIARLLPNYQTPLEGDENDPPTTFESSSTSPLSTSPTSPTGSSSSETPAPRKKTADIVIPDHWRPEIEQCIEDKCFSDSARNEVVRTLVNQLFTTSSKPSRNDCEQLARKLILVYPFAKDDLGNGYQSWSDKMVERIRNVIKRDYKKGKRPAPGLTPTVSKRKKTGEKLLNRYPVVSTALNALTPDDPETMEQHNKAISKEMDKARPRDSILLQLMKSTYTNRRMYILDELSTFEQSLSTYPALRRPAVIIQEMELVCAKNDVKSKFIEQWAQYVPAILSYAEKSSKKSVSCLLVDIEDSDESMKAVTALKVLAASLEKTNKSLCYLYEEYLDADSVDSVCRKPPCRTQPRIAAIKGEELIQHFVICEQRVFCKVVTLPMALFVAFSLYYCFNLEYPVQAKNIFSFFQDFILCQPDSGKKSGGYLAVVSDIKRNLVL